jgi:hypothetical protein
MSARTQGPPRTSRSGRSGRCRAGPRPFRRQRSRREDRGAASSPTPGRSARSVGCHAFRAGARRREGSAPASPVSRRHQDRRSRRSVLVISASGGQMSSMRIREHARMRIAIPPRPRVPFRRLDSREWAACGPDEAVAPGWQQRSSWSESSHETNGGGTSTRLPTSDGALRRARGLSPPVGRLGRRRPRRRRGVARATKPFSSTRARRVTPERGNPASTAVTLRSRSRSQYASDRARRAQPIVDPTTLAPGTRPRRHADRLRGRWPSRPRPRSWATTRWRMSS